MLATTRRPLALQLVPVGAAWQVALVVAAAALLALAAQVQVRLPFSPVPVTGQTFVVLLSGAALGARLGPASVALYVVGGAAGVARLTGPTGGYLVGFIVAAYVVGALAERGWDRRLWSAMLAMLAGEVAIYVFGLAWLARFPVAAGVLDAGLYPFIPGDLYKLVLAALALPAGWRLLRR